MLQNKCYQQKCVLFRGKKPVEGRENMKTQVNLRDRDPLVRFVDKVDLNKEREN